MKPGFYVCGGGNVNCSDWDDVNGCWQDMDDVDFCPKFRSLNEKVEGDLNG